MELNIHEIARQIAEEALDNITYCGKTIREWVELINAFERLGDFGNLFVAYTGCPRGAMGRACMPIEEEVLRMKPITDVDGGRWIPVNADALHELVKKYASLRPASVQPVVRCLATGGMCSKCTPGPCDHRRVVIPDDSGQ